ncbi:response regulator [Azoarcus indigens]|uniref:Excisionase family DNA binding protein n=1 Tax=Azoarcus indigens TaxID=29545 RepID=A0A4R6DRN2_9RHOO|nr:response regulator [Azoarcus indigens]NMG67938.1 response regulator [Azoarcus indigens]TDN47765.1 excisionase family DNA binding protein [Azoarcus indigens]
MSKTTRAAQEFISTAQAAKQLGLSLGAVQQMVESGTLEAWKTAGGHRRIRQASVDALLAGRSGTAPALEEALSDHLRILIVDDHPALQQAYRETFSSWDLPLEIEQYDHPLDALVAVGRQPPNLLITDPHIHGMDGFDMIRRLRDNPLADDVAIVAVSTLSQQEIEAAGGLPADVTIYGKPIPFHELHGYMQAMMSRLRRLAARALRG